MCDNYTENGKSIEKLEIEEIGDNPISKKSIFGIKTFVISKQEFIQMSIGFITVFKAAIGTGILFSPRGVVNTGYLMSALVMLYYWILNVTSTLLLMQCADRVEANYSGIATEAMGKMGKILLEMSLVSTAISFGSVYVTFITNNIQDIIAGIYNCSQDYLNYGSALITFIQLFVYLPLVCARKIQTLAPIILTSNIALISAITLVLVQSFRTLIKNHMNSSFHKIPIYTDSSNIPGFIGTAAYLWVCAPVALSYYVSLKTKKERKFFTWVYIAAIFVVFVFALIFTFLCAFAYGEDTLIAITLNLPFTPIAMAGKIFYSLSVLLSLPLMIYPMKEIFHKYSRIRSNDTVNENDFEIKSYKNDDKIKYSKSNSTISIEDSFSNKINEIIDKNLNNKNIELEDENNIDSKIQNNFEIKDLEVESQEKVPKLKHFFKSQKDNILPSLLMMLSCLVITSMGYILHDSLGNLINLIGGLFCVPLNILLPALFHMIIFRKELSIRMMILDLLLVISGVFTSLLVIWYSILNWRTYTQTTCSMKDSEGFN